MHLLTLIAGSSDANYCYYSCEHSDDFENGCKVNEELSNEDTQVNMCYCKNADECNKVPCSAAGMDMFPSNGEGSTKKDEEMMMPKKLKSLSLHSSEVNLQISSTKLPTLLLVYIVY